MDEGLQQKDVPVHDEENRDACPLPLPDEGKLLVDCKDLLVTNEGCSRQDVLVDIAYRVSVKLTAYLPERPESRFRVDYVGDRVSLK